MNDAARLTDAPWRGRYIELHELGRKNDRAPVPTDTALGAQDSNALVRYREPALTIGAGLEPHPSETNNTAFPGLFSPAADYRCVK